MTPKGRRIAIGMSSAAILAIAPAGAAAATGRTVACYSKKSGELYRTHTGSCGHGQASVTWVAGPQGAIGPQGNVGPQETTGPQGSLGAQGGSGPQGPQGFSGAIGPQGTAGFAGAQGTSGSQGKPGAQGAQGAQGAFGPAGNPAETGGFYYSGAGAAPTLGTKYTLEYQIGLLSGPAIIHAVLLTQLSASVTHSTSTPPFVKSSYSSGPSSMGQQGTGPCVPGGHYCHLNYSSPPPTPNNSPEPTSVECQLGRWSSRGTPAHETLFGQPVQRTASPTSHNHVDRELVLATTASVHSSFVGVFCKGGATGTTGGATTVLGGGLNAISFDQIHGL